MHQPLNQQNMLAPNIRFVAEENLRNLARFVAGLRAVLRLNKLANHGDVQRPHQISHEHKGIFQNGQGLDRLSLVVVGDVAPQFLHPLLDLFGTDDLPKRLNSRYVHEPAFLLRLAQLELNSPEERFRSTRRPPSASPGSESLLAAVWHASWLEPETRASTRSHSHTQQPAKACAPAEERVAPAAAPLPFSGTSCGLAKTGRPDASSARLTPSAITRREEVAADYTPQSAIPNRYTMPRYPPPIPPQKHARERQGCIRSPVSAPSGANRVSQK